MPNTIKEILDVEKKGEKILIAAEKRKAGRISKAKEKAFEKLADERQLIDSEIERKAAAIIRDINKNKEKLREKHETEAAELEKGAMKNLGKAADLVLKKILEGKK